MEQPKSKALALSWVITTLNIESTEKCLQDRADPNYVIKPDGATPFLLHADNIGQPFFEEVFILLLQSGADTNSKRTRAIFGTFLERCIFVYILVNRGLPVNSRRDIDEETYFQGLSLVINYLSSEAGIDVNQINRYGDTILSNTIKHSLFFAVKNKGCQGFEKLLLFLNKFNFDWNVPTQGGMTPLHWLCTVNDTQSEIAIPEKILEAAIAGGANIEAVTIFGWSALHVACTCGSYGMVKALVGHGTNLQIKDKFGMTPLDIALQGVRRSHIKNHDPVNANETLVAFLRNKMNNFTAERSQFMAQEGEEKEAYLSMFPCFQAYIESNDEGIIHELRGSSTEFIRKLFEAPKMGYLADTDEVQQVSKDVERLMKRLAQEIGNMDPLFQCEAGLSGSVAECTKIGTPEEADYNFYMKEFEACTIIPKERSTSAQLKPPETDTAHFTPYLKQENGKMFLDAWHLKHHFIGLVTKALSKKDIWRDLRLRWIVSDVVDGHVFYNTLYLMWMGSNYTGMLLSIDIMPAILFGQWPDGFINPQSHLLPDHVRNSKCCVVIKHETFQLSACLLECYMMQTFPQIPKLAYILWKIVLNALKYVGVRDILPCSYDLKNALFYIMDDIVKTKQGAGMSESVEQGPGMSESGEQGPGMSESGEQGPGMSESGEQGPGMSESGEQGPGMSVSGEQGPGMAELREQGPGILESGEQGLGISESGEQGPGMSELREQGPGMSESGEQGPGMLESGKHRTGMSGEHESSMLKSEDHEPSMSESREHVLNMSESGEQGPGMPDLGEQRPGISDLGEHGHSKLESGEHEPNKLESGEHEPSMLESREHASLQTNTEPKIMQLEALMTTVKHPKELTDENIEHIRRLTVAILQRTQYSYAKTPGYEHYTKYAFRSGIHFKSRLQKNVNFWERTRKKLTVILDQ